MWVICALLADLLANSDNMGSIRINILARIFKREWARVQFFLCISDGTWEHVHTRTSLSLYTKFSFFENHVFLW